MDDDGTVLTQLLSDGFSEEFLRSGTISSTPLASIERGLKEIGILSAEEQLIAYADRAGWHRGGAETYVSTFEATTVLNHFEQHYYIIAKAIVKWGVPPEKVISDWTKRQQRLDEFGVCTPHSFANWKGIIFQQFIPFSFTDYLRSTSTEKAAQLIQELLGMAVKVDEAGFEPNSFVEDLRTDGSVLFVVDFGEDLGHFSESRCGSVAMTRTVNWIKNNRILDAGVSSCLEK